MRLTRKNEEDKKYYPDMNVLCSQFKGNYREEIHNKLGQLEDIEEELGIDLITLFDSKYAGAYLEMELEKEDKTIFFDGDTFFGHYTAEQFLDLIKDMLSMYKKLVKLKEKLH